MKKNKIVIIGFAAICIMFFMLNENVLRVIKGVFSGNDSEYGNMTIVLDAGHGGKDPGKVGVDNSLEKDINLDIVLELSRQLKEKGVNVILIRNKDCGLYQEGDRNKKQSDLRKRIDIINSSQAGLMVSIHQNSYPNESVRGAQVFYYDKSECGKKAAQSIQNAINNNEDKNDRKIKANSNYYLLKKASIPAVIVECGFLSNSEEAKKLQDENYQKKISKSICEGIITYLNSMMD